MFDLFGHSPSAGSYRHDPMTADEIDAHQDGDRIWATISAIRTEAEEGREELAEEWAEDAKKEVRELCEYNLDQWIEDFLDRAEGKGRDWIIEELTNAHVKAVLS